MNPVVDAGIDSRANEVSTSRIAQNLKFMSLGAVGSALLQYALYSCVARYLGSQAYGAFSIALTIGIIGAPLCDLGMSLSLVRTCSRDAESMPSVLGATLLWRAILCVPVGVAGLAACRLAGYSSQVLWLFVPLYLASVCDGISTLSSAVFQVREQMLRSSLILLARNALRAAALLAAVVSHAGPERLALGFLAASAIGAGGSWYCVRCCTPVNLSRQALAPTLREALPFGSTIIAVLLHMQVGVTLLGHMRSESEVGLFHAALRFIVLAQLIPQTVAVVSAPLAFRLGLRGGAASSRLYRIQATALAALGLCGTLLLALHGQDLVRLGLGPNYQGSAALVIAIAPVVFIKFLSIPLGDTLTSLGLQRRLMCGHWCALLVNVVLSVVLIPRFGAHGAVMATLTSETFLLAFMIGMAALAKLSLGWSTVLRHPLGLALSVLLLCWGSSCVVPSTARFLVLPFGACAYALIVMANPTKEERLLFKAASAHVR